MIDIEKVRKSAQKRVDEKIKEKINSIEVLLSLIGISHDELLELYEGESFRDSNVLKKELFDKLLTNQLVQEDKEFLSERINLVNSRQKDNRTPLEYSVDLIIGWLEEDAIRAYLLSKGIKIELNGSDSKREFLTQRELSTKSDFIIGNKLVEIVFDRSDHWMTHKKVDLRDKKYERLVEEKSILLGLAPTSGMGFWIDVTDPTYEFSEKYIPGYGKPGYSFPNINNYMYPIKEVLDNFCDFLKKNEI